MNTIILIAIIAGVGILAYFLFSSGALSGNSLSNAINQENANVAQTLANQASQYTAILNQYGQNGEYYDSVTNSYQKQPPRYHLGPTPT